MNLRGTMQNGCTKGTRNIFIFLKKTLEIGLNMEYIKKIILHTNNRRKNNGVLTVLGKIKINK